MASELGCPGISSKVSAAYMRQEQMAETLFNRILNAIFVTRPKKGKLETHKATTI